jgi:glycosyltransferase involved in cell wall biosynthesis
MTARPAVSVAIVTYNQERFVAETLDSVLGQDFQDFEVVVGDDASTDRTPHILAEYEAAHPGRVRVLRHPANLGITGNCNATLEACNGEFVAWLGGDDLFMPGKLRTQHAAMQLHPEASYSYHVVEAFESDTGRSIELIHHGDPLRRDVREIVASANFPRGSALMHRRDRAPRHGFRAEMPWESTVMFSIEMAFHGPVLRLAEPLTRYRMHETQVTSDAAGNVAATYVDLLKTYELLGQEHPELRGAIRKGLAEIHHREARKLERSGAAPREVLRRLAPALRLDPRHAEAWRLLGIVALGAKRMRDLGAARRAVASGLSSRRT